MGVGTCAVEDAAEGRGCTLLSKEEISRQRHGAHSSQRRRFRGVLTMTKTAGELAAAIGAELEGDRNFEVRGVAAPECAGVHDLIYVEAAKHAGRAGASAAACLIASEGITISGKTILRHAQPKVAFAKAAAIVVERAPIATGIHATAIVAPLAHVGKNVSIGPYAVIGEDAHISDGTQIGAHCVIG